MKNCKNCENFIPYEDKHQVGFIYGSCSNEPFDIRDMRKNDMAVACGHDGIISVGENFGCINFNNRTNN